jgi:hypothetical protein
VKANPAHGVGQRLIGVLRRTRAMSKPVYAGAVLSAVRRAHYAVCRPRVVLVQVVLAFGVRDGSA